MQNKVQEHIEECVEKVKLTSQFGKVFSVDNLANMRNFYIVYGKPEKVSRISTDYQTVLPSKEELKRLIEQG